MELVIGTVADPVINGIPCHQTLTVGTSQETATTSPPYPIYLFEIDLNPGWNLISLPGIPENTAIEVVLEDLLPPTCDGVHGFEVWYYDCGSWWVFCSEISDYQTLTTMDECKAYWIYLEGTATASFRVKGSWYPAPPGPPLKKCYHECWNMVGFTSDVNREPFVQEAGAGIPACDVAGLAPYFGSLAPPNTVIYILGYDGGWFAVEQYPPGGPPAVAPNRNCLEVGMGYWVAFSADACFAPPPPGI